MQGTKMSNCWIFMKFVNGYDKVKHKKGGLLEVD